MAELDNMIEKHRKIIAESESGQMSLEESKTRISELKSKLEALENRKSEEQVNLTTSDDQVPTKPESSIFCHYFNNYTVCRFKEITGRQCRFLHRRSLRCRFGFACNRKKCMYQHHHHLPGNFHSHHLSPGNIPHLYGVQHHHRGPCSNSGKTCVSMLGTYPLPSTFDKP